MSIRKAGIFPIAGIEDFISAGDSTDYYDMYLNAGNMQSDLNNLALASEGQMNTAAINALGKFYDGVAQSKILEQKAGTKPHPLNTALGMASTVAGLIPGGGFGSGLTTGDPSNVISDPTDTFKSLSGPGGALEGGVYDYWGS